MNSATMNSATKLIQYLNRGGTNGYYWMKPPSAPGQPEPRAITRWFNADNPPDLPEGSFNLYFGVNPTNGIPVHHRNGKRIPQQHLRAYLSDIAAINCLFSEFDAKDFPGDDLEGKKSSARDHINRLKLPPNVLIDSGGGFHAYWLLMEPIIIKDEFTRDRLADLQKRWVEFVHGDTNTADIARVLRVPGSYNFKYDPPREVLIIFEDYDIPYELSDLARLIPPPPPPINSPVPAPAPKTAMLASNGPIQKNPRSWLDKAIGRAASQGRNKTGLWLACQLRDDGISIDEARPIMISYAEAVRAGPGYDHDYREDEALASLNNAYFSTNNKFRQREPARGERQVLAPINVTHRPAGNGSVSHSGNGKSVTDLAAAAPVSSQNGDNHRADPVTGEAPSVTKEPVKAPVDVENLLRFASQDHDGHALCVRSLYPHKFAYCDKWGWLFYDGKAWRMEGAEGAVNRAIIQTLKKRRDAGKQIDGGDSLIKCSKANASNINGVRDVLKNYVEVFTDDFDNNPDLLNCSNGVVNLRTGELTQHSAGQRFTYVIPVEYDPHANYEPWLSLLKETVNHDELVDYLQVAIGYSLTGHTYEEVLFYLYGPPRSGKGTFTETILAMLKKPLAVEADMQTFTSVRNGDTQNFDLAPLKPCRFVAASESGKNAPLNPEKIKAMTGRNQVRCAFKHKDHFEYIPSFKIWLSSNHPVNIDVEDDAAWGRVRVIQFPNSHLGKEDKTLKVRMTSAVMLRGVLRWAVEGAQLYYQFWESGGKGLPLPDIVREATEAQRNQQDNIRSFLEECCEVVKDHATPSAEIYQAYKSWCENNGVPPKYRNQLTLALSNRGYSLVIQKVNRKTVRMITGLKLI